MSINIYLNFDGNCREAVDFYAKVFETETPQIMTFGDSPPNPDFPLPEGAKNLVMHSRINIFGSTLMFSDNFPGHEFTLGNNVSIALVSNEEQKLRDVFRLLSEGGQVVSELQETFFSKCFGNVVDQFGIQWIINYEENFS